MLENLKNKAKNSGLNRTNLTVIGVVMVATGVYILHRGRINNVIELSQAAVQDTMWASYNSGIRYGLELANDVGRHDVAIEAGIDAGFEFAKAGVK